MTDGPPVLIAGAGVGGLALALSLHERGVPCTVFEAAEEIRQLGVGINVLPHAVGEMATLGLLPALDAVGVRTHELHYLNRFGQRVLVEKRGLHAGHAVPQFSIRRGHLHGVLLAAARERLGAAAVRTGHRLVGYDQDEGGVTARFEGGRSARGAVLVGADGIHSRLRAILHPSDGGIRWTGIRMWRGAADWPVFLDGASMVVAGGMDEKAVVYPIGPGSSPDRRLTNWVVCVRERDGDAPPPHEDWSRRGDLAELLPKADRFRLGVVDLTALVRATGECWVYPMADRDPLPWWGLGRVTLLGDAAHPMYPVGSNGASQAVLDARALARALATLPPLDALRTYEVERLAATTQIIRSNRAGGPERVVDVVSARAPDGFERLEDVLSPDELVAIGREYAAMAGFAVRSATAAG